PVPDSLRRLTTLRSLWLDHTLRLGAIPAIQEWLGARDLVHLSLASNPFTPGPIPDLSGSRNLFLLDLGETNRTGSLPEWLAGARLLGYLLLERNRLEGGIPESWGALTSLRTLWLRSNRLTGQVPAALTALGLLEERAGLDLRWNSLRQSEPGTLAFLNAKQAGRVDFRDTQTLTPRGVAARSLGPDSVLLTWDPIRYRADEGYYAVFKATAPEGPYTLAGRTASKHDTALEVIGLTPRTVYWFIVRAVTEPHAENANRVVSPPTPPVRARTFP
ncbi:MAG TPA: hypothetical protein VEI97_18360, partial [bacterium]|nr:hypothetical protein [bacterium]